MNAMRLGGRRLPYSYNMLWVSLAGALTVLVPVFLLHYLGIISIETATWITLVVIVAAAIYESSLLYLLTRHMFGKLRRDRDEEP